MYTFYQIQVKKNINMKRTKNGTCVIHKYIQKREGNIGIILADMNFWRMI